MKHRIPIIGLLGGVGAGKSTAAAELAALGCRVIDGDSIGRELLQSPVVRKLLRKQWGEGIFDSYGAVSRPVVAEKVFSDPKSLAALNRILHPHPPADSASHCPCPPRGSARDCPGRRGADRSPVGRPLHLLHIRTGPDGAAEIASLSQGLERPSVAGQRKIANFSGQ